MKSLAFALLSLIAAVALAQLPPAAEADRLLLKGMAAMDAKDPATAAASFADAEKTGVRLPESFPYHYARALIALGRFSEAKARLASYLKDGSSARFYREALEAYNAAEAGEQKEAKRRSDYQAKIDGCPEEYRRRRKEYFEEFELAERQCERRREGHCYRDDSAEGRRLARRLRDAYEQHRDMPSEGAWCSRRYPPLPSPK